MSDLDLAGLRWVVRDRLGADDAAGVFSREAVSRVAGPQHRTPEYRRAYRALKAAQRAGQWLLCVEPVCVKASRDIAPWMPAHVCHDPSGTVIIGPGHRGCNITEVNERRQGKRRARRLVL